MLRTKWYPCIVYVFTDSDFAVETIKLHDLPTDDWMERTKSNYERIYWKTVTLKVELI